MIEKYIEHTCIRQKVSFEEIGILCLTAWLYNFRSVVVRPKWVKIAKDLLGYSKVKVVTILGFPYGLTYIPVYKKGSPLDLADELDIMPNISDVKNEKYHEVVKRLSYIRKHFKKPLKLIVETGVFTEKEIKWLCIFADDLGFEYVKSNTGLYPRKRQVIDDLEIIKSAVSGTNLKIKMAGGIKDYCEIRHLIAMGVSLIGTSSGIKIVEGERDGLSKV